MKLPQKVSFGFEACEMGPTVGTWTCPSCPKGSKWGRNPPENKGLVFRWLHKLRNTQGKKQESKKKEGEKKKKYIYIYIYTIFVYKKKTKKRQNVWATSSRTNDNATWNAQTMRFFLASVIIFKIWMSSCVDAGKIHHPTLFLVTRSTPDPERWTSLNAIFRVNFCRMSILVCF